MKTSIISFTLILLLSGCKEQAKQTNQTNQINQDTLKPETNVLASPTTISDYVVDGDSLIIPAFEIEVRYSDKAAAKLKKSNETTIVSAMFTGEPTNKKDANEMGLMDIAGKDIELTSAKNVARFEHIKFSKKQLDALADKDITLLINVYTGRKVFPDNLLDCGIVDAKASAFKNKRYIMKSKLIDENGTSMTNIANSVIPCYAPIAAPADAKTEKLSLIINCDEKGKMTFGDKPIKDLDAFKKAMAIELSEWKKYNTELPDLKTQGCLMGAGGELQSIFSALKTAPANTPK